MKYCRKSEIILDMARNSKGSPTRRLDVWTDVFTKTERFTRDARISHFPNASSGCHGCWWLTVVINGRNRYLKWTSSSTAKYDFLMRDATIVEAREVSAARDPNTSRWNALPLRAVIPQVPRIRTIYKETITYEATCAHSRSISGRAVVKISHDQNVGGTRRLGAEQLSRQIRGESQHGSTEHCLAVGWGYVALRICHPLL